MKLFVAKITWYSDNDGPIHDNVVIAAESFASANAQLTDIFGDEHLETINLTLINPDRAFAFIDAVTYDGLLEADI